MALVKAQMSFYHDAVGTKAKDEVFEVKSEETLSQLEQAGYVTRVDNQTQQAFDQAKNLEQQVGQRNALTNEAVSLASHEHNMKAAQHQQQFAQMREQAGQAAVEQEIRKLEAEGQTQRAEQLRSALESQRTQMAQQQQRQQQGQSGPYATLATNNPYPDPSGEASRNARMTAEQVTMATQGINQATPPEHRQEAEAKQAAANTANTAQQARAKKADK